MTMIINDCDEIVVEQKSILQEQTNFYQKLYTSNENISFTLRLRESDPKLSPERKSDLECNISIDELTQAVKSMPNGKSPGFDGLPVELYKILWSRISDIFHKAINLCIQRGELMTSARKGVITLVPKKDRNLAFIKNWRPITLLNVEYKIIAKALASRIKNVLPDIIDAEQTRFMAGRSIFENIRSAIEVIEYSLTLNEPNILMSIDYEKCFDLIEHRSIWGTMKQLNFGDKFIAMVKMLYTGFSSCVQNNGFTSPFFEINRSVFQGSPLSSFLFLLCSQIFTRLIKNNGNIVGIDVNTVKFLLGQFADDTDLYLKFEADTLNNVVQVLDTVYHNLGFKVNYDKTTIYRMGSLHNSDAKLYSIKPFCWTNQPPNVLGVTVSSYHDTDTMSSNFNGLIVKCEAILNQWQNRRLNLSGKVLVINTLVASLFVYKMSVLPNVNYDYILKFNDIIAKFLGNKKRIRIPLTTLQLSRSEGGLKLVNLYLRQLALKAQWIIFIRDSPKWSHIAYTYINPTLSNRVWTVNLHSKDVNTISPGNSFWHQVLYAWCEFNFTIPQETSDILGQIIWCNSNIRINDKPVCNIVAWRAGLVYVSDLVAVQGIFYTYPQIVAKYGDCISWYQHVQILSAMPLLWKQGILSTNTLVANKLNNYDKIAGTTKITNMVYNKLIDNNDRSFIETQRDKWQTRLQCELCATEFRRAFRDILAPTIYTKLRDFQYHLLMNNIVTNFNLFVWKKVESDRCTFCKAEREHLTHLFWSCNLVSQLWTQIQAYIFDNNSDLDSTLEWNARNIFFNSVHPKPGHVVNLLILIVKQYIYRSRCSNSQLSFQHLLNEITTTKNIEYQIAKEKGKLVKHYRKWSQIYLDMVMSENEI